MCVSRVKGEVGNGIVSPSGEVPEGGDFAGGGSLPTARLPSTGPAAQVAAAVDRLVIWLARHWLAVFNTIVGVFVALPFLAPALMHLGEVSDCRACVGVSRLIYLAYSPTCHQLPERSFFLFGRRGVYSAADLEALGALPIGLNILQRQILRFVGDPEVGYKVAFCERDAAIYGSILLSGLLFGLLRWSRLRSEQRLTADRGTAPSHGLRRWPKLPLWLYGLLLMPMVIDGAVQLLGWRESSWPLRLLTGGLFGAATVWLAYPYVQEAMDDIATPGNRAAPNWTKANG